MTHDVDGFDLKFTSRTSWKAERRLHGKLLDIVPVTWTKGLTLDKDAGVTRLQVWFQNPADLEQHRARQESFVVAMAVARDYDRRPHAFKEFRAIFEVRSTGRKIDLESIETQVVRRLSPMST